MIPIPLSCGQCGAKLKVRAGGMRPLTEVKCPKCGNAIPVPKEAPPENAQAAGATTLPKPEEVASVPPPQPPPPAEPKKPFVVTPGTQAGHALISATCANCKKEVKVPGDLAGKKVRCKGCGAAIAIPAREAQQTPPSPVPTRPSPPAPSPPASPAATEAQAAATPVTAAQPVSSAGTVSAAIVALEGEIAELRRLKEDTIRDIRTEIEATERRLAELKHRLARLT